MSNQKVRFQTISHFIPIQGEKLHLLEIIPNATSPLLAPIMLMHGAIENGKIFYSNSQKGLAFFLASHGFPVFIPDLRGRGKSTPLISKNTNHGQYESITQDIPLFYQLIKDKFPEHPQIWFAHSWGGVLLSSCLLRFPEIAKNIQSLVYLGVKRSVLVHNIYRYFYIDLMWKGVASLVREYKGYLPPVLFGSDAESKQSHKDSLAWVKKSKWIDTKDHFDYASKVKETLFPPSLWMTGSKDLAMGHPKDMFRFIDEMKCRENSTAKILGKDNNYLHNYGHIDLLTHPDASKDHFLEILSWIKKHGQ